MNQQEGHTVKLTFILAGTSFFAERLRSAIGFGLTGLPEAEVLEMKAMLHS